MAGFSYVRKRTFKRTVMYTLYIMVSTNYKRMTKTTENKVPLSEEEKVELSTLLERAKNTDIKGEIWYQMVKKFITVPVELCVLDKDNKVFLVYRKDREFDGYHLPGTIVNDWETVHDARVRLMEGEIKKDAGFTISYPESIGWLQVRRGEGENDSPTRNTVALLHIARLEGDFTPQEGYGFYMFDNIPKSTLKDHKFILRYFKRYLENGHIILGE